MRALVRLGRRRRRGSPHPPARLCSPGPGLGPRRGGGWRGALPGCSARRRHPPRTRSRGASRPGPPGAAAAAWNRVRAARRGFVHPRPPRRPSGGRGRRRAGRAARPREVAPRVGASRLQGRSRFVAGFGAVRVLGLRGRGRGASVGAVGGRGRDGVPVAHPAKPGWHPARARPARGSPGGGPSGVLRGSLSFGCTGGAWGGGPDVLSSPPAPPSGRPS